MELGLNLLEYYNVLRAAYTVYSDRVSNKYGISRRELDILLFLANNKQYDTAAEIVEMKHLAKSHVSVIISRLEESGLITRSFAAGNHKTVHISLTEASMPIISDGMNIRKEFAETIFKGMDEKDMESARAFMDKVKFNANSFLNDNQ